MIPIGYHLTALQIGMTLRIPLPRSQAAPQIHWRLVYARFTDRRDSIA